MQVGRIRQDERVKDKVDGMQEVFVFGPRFFFLVETKVKIP